MLKHRSFDGFRIKPSTDFLESRKPVLVNNDCQIVLTPPQEGMENYFYKNADADELLFIHEGSWLFRTMYWDQEFGFGDYLIMARETPTYFLYS